ncbi:MAG: D-alanyl-D-alanine carboxypeptidase/D-alanyl-D-alanine endopeptidase [Acidimicrobiales bacterium]
MPLRRLCHRGTRTGLALATMVIVGTISSPVAASTPPRPVPSTPVFSLRRLPAFVSGTVADQRLAVALKPVMDATGGPADKACLSVRDPDGRVAFARNPTTPLIPASTMKLQTATAALARLGGDFRFTTQVRAAGPVTNATVAGDIWLVGSGDPLLATADFAAVAGYQGQPRLATSMEALADRVVAAGVRSIGGRVVGDESRYDTTRYLPSWSPTYATDAEIGPQSALTVNDGFAAFRPRAVPAPAPASNAAALLTTLLRARGVTVGTDAGEGGAPGGSSTVAAVESSPLRDVVGVMLQESDNLAAELLVKELGTRFAGAGTTAAGTAVVRATLASMGLGGAGMAAVDGSGLDRSDRLTCDLLQATLARNGQGSELGRDLPVAGRNGTLARRFRGTPAAGKVAAKTGSLKGVTGLAGWTTTLDGRALQFALLANDLSSDGVGAGLEDRVVSALAGWPQAPSAADIGPRPLMAAATVAPG